MPHVDINVIPPPIGSHPPKISTNTLHNTNRPRIEIYTPVAMSAIKAPARLPELVKTAFNKALADGDLLYFSTKVQDIRVGALSFQLRFSPSLANKPKASPSTTEASTPKKVFDPFAYHPQPRLFVADVGASHFLVLNKFAVVPEHFILATSEFKPQTHVLEADDLAATLACIHAYEQHGSEEAGSSEAPSHAGGLFAFFNCGEHSGASQPHRHIQLLPVARMRDGLQADSPWEVLAAKLSTVAAPFTTFSAPINHQMSPKELHDIYIRLYKQAVSSVSQYNGSAAQQDPPEVGETAISYNMAMTKDTLTLCPRLAEGGALTSRETGQAVGMLSLNGTMLAGTALVKSEAEWDTLRSEPQELVNVLRRVGVPQPAFNDGTNRL